MFSVMSPIFYVVLMLTLLVITLNLCHVLFLVHQQKKNKGRKQ